MENVIYIDDLIKRIIKKWKQVGLILLITCLIMGIMGGINVFKGRKYVYQASFVIENSRYDDIADAMKLALKVLESNDIYRETDTELSEKYSYQEISGMIEFLSYYDGTIVVSFVVDEAYANDFDFDYMKKYISASLQKISEFEGITYIMLEEPFIKSQPEELSVELVKGTLPYIITGGILGVITGVVVVALMILWNPEEYKSKKEE